MPDKRRSWTEEDIAKLKNMAGKLSLFEIATRLNRTAAATATAGVSTSPWKAC